MIIELATKTKETLTMFEDDGKPIWDGKSPLRALPALGPLTPEQQKRVDDHSAELLARSELRKKQYEELFKDDCSLG